MASYSNMPVYLYGNISLSNAQDRFPLWNTINSNQQEYYEVEVFDDRNDEGEKLKNIDAILNMTTYTCHICNIDLPKVYIKEHINSVKHETCLKITNIALERTHLYMKSDLIEPSLKLKVEGTYFCEHCATIVQNCDSVKHKRSRTHLVSVENDGLMQKLVSAYQDKDSQIGIRVDIDSFHLSEDNLQQMNNKFFDIMSSEFDLDIAVNNKPNIKEYDYKEDGKEALKSVSIKTEFSAENIRVGKKKKIKNSKRKKLNENKITDDYKMTSKEGEQCDIVSTSSKRNLAETIKKTDEEITIESLPLKEEFQIKECKEMYADDNKIINKKKAKRNKSKQNMKDFKENSNADNSEIVFEEEEQNGEKKQNEKDTQNDKGKQNENDKLHEKEQQNGEKKQNKKNYNDEKDKQFSKESSIRWGITEEVGTKTHDNLSIYLEFLSIRNETLKAKALTDSIVELRVVGGEKAIVPLLHFHGYDIVGDGAIVCRICRGIGLVNAKEHRWDETHISKVMSPVDKHFIRQLDDTFSHCILCNTLHLTAEIPFHVAHIVHKVNRQNSQQWEQDRVAQLIHLNYERRYQE